MMKLLRVSFFLMLSAFAGQAFAGTAADEELYNGLFSWAVKLSGLPTATPPRVEFKPHAFFVDAACGGHECKVWGWYPNTGGNVVYVEETAATVIKDGSDQRSTLAASIVVHEDVHYLQAAKRGFAKYSCEEAIGLERQAYQAQRDYLMQYGRYLPIGISMHNAGCEAKKPEQSPQ